MAEELKACSQRKAFEAAILAANGQVPGNYNPEYDRYVSERRQGQYEGWKLARAQLPSQGGEAVACLVRSRNILTPARLAHDGKDHFTEWSEWSPGTLSHGEAVTQPGRNTPALYEMRLLYTHPADQVAEGVVVSQELLERIARLCMYTLPSADYDELRALLAKSEGVKK